MERRVGLKFPTVNEGEFREALQSPHVTLSQKTNNDFTVFEVFIVALLLHTVFYHILITKITRGFLNHLASCKKILEA